MKILMAVFLIISFSCENFNTDKGQLTDKEITIQVKDMFFACDCARWINTETLDSLYKADIDVLDKHCFYIEPDNNSLELPDTLGYFNDIIEIKGSFYEKEGYPKDYSSDQNPDPAKVFRYTSYKVIKSNYSKQQELLGVK